MIAAAPELLEALEAIRFEVLCAFEDAPKGPLGMAVKRAEAVLAKARGQS